MLDALSLFNQELALLSELIPLWVKLVMVGVVCLALGSYSNSVIFRSPLSALASFERGVVEEYQVPRERCGYLNKWERFSHTGDKRSKCTKCGTKIRLSDNIPLLSYIYLRGSCRSCGERYSPRYVFAEGLFLVVGLASFYWVFGGVFSVDFLVFIGFALTSVFIFFIDLENRVICNSHSVAYQFLFVLFLVLSPVGEFITLDGFVQACSYLVFLHIMVNVPIAKLKGVDSAVGEGDLGLLLIGAALVSMVNNAFPMYELLQVFSVYLILLGVFALACFPFTDTKTGQIPAAPSILLVNATCLIGLLLV